MRTYILDTNVLLQDCNIFYKFLNKGNVLIGSLVVQELDTFKNNYDTIGKNARSHMRFLNDLIKETDLRLIDGVSVEGCINKLYSFSIPNEICANADDEIVKFCKAIKTEEDITVVSNDINLRLRLNSDLSIKVRTETFSEDNIVHNSTIYNGFHEVMVSPDIIRDIYDLDVELSINDIKEEFEEELFPNQFISFKSYDGSKASALVRYQDLDESLSIIKTKFPEIEKLSIFPRNREQIFALNLLLDPTIPIVTLIGPAGSGKTLITLASAMAQTDRNVFSKKKGVDPSLYKKIVVSRPIQPMGRDIGFLPGSIEEKMSPWVQPIVDNLEYLFGGDSMIVNELLTNGTIQIEAPTYIRGRTINNAFIIIDEAQNLSRHELKTILTRVGEGTKIVLTGDIEQIDNRDLDETTNGLTYVVEKFKNYDISGHVTLIKGERSELATLASRIL